jgi:hypothetical protein
MTLHIISAASFQARSRGCRGTLTGVIAGASEAIQSLTEGPDCFGARAPLRKRFAFVAGNDIRIRRASAFPRHDLPELCVIGGPQMTEGAGNAGRPMRPQPRAQNEEAHELVTTVTPVSPGIPRANGFNGLFRALPGDRAFLSPSLTDHHPISLISASGYQDHTASPYACRCVRLAHRSIHRIPRPTCRDDRDTPL